MTAKIFSLLVIGGAIAFASCEGTGDGTPADGDSTATIEKAPDNTSVDKDAASGTTLDDDTRDFVTEAASGGLTEVELGQMAQQKAVNQRVKDFGAMMVRDHSKANEDLKTAVSGKITLPTTISDKHQGHINDLKEETGADFDRDYIKMMVDHHEANINKFESIAKDSKDQAVRDFANNALPTLRNHLAEAKSIRDELSKMKK